MNTIKVKLRIVERIKNSFLIFAVYVGLGLYSCAAQAQSTLKPIHTGIEGTYGVRTFKIKSDIPELSNLSVIEEGGDVGVFLSTQYFKLNARTGFYYSSASVPYTIDLFNAEAQFDFYPLQFIQGRQVPLDIYVSAGFGMNKVKFYGHYLKDARINHSDINEPYLGNVVQMLASTGVGLSYHFQNVDFLSVFAEVKRSFPIQSTLNGTAFTNTSLDGFSAITIGVSIGR